MLGWFLTAKHSFSPSAESPPLRSSELEILLKLKSDFVLPCSKPPVVPHLTQNKAVSYQDPGDRPDPPSPPHPPHSPHFTWLLALPDLGFHTVCSVCLGGATWPPPSCTQAFVQMSPPRKAFPTITISNRPQNQQPLGVCPFCFLSLAGRTVGYQRALCPFQPWSGCCLIEAVTGPTSNIQAGPRVQSVASEKNHTPPKM